MKTQAKQFCLGLDRSAIETSGPQIKIAAAKWSDIVTDILLLWKV